MSLILHEKYPQKIYLCNLHSHNVEGVTDMWWGRNPCLQCVHPVASVACPCARNYCMACCVFLVFWTMHWLSWSTSLKLCVWLLLLLIASKQQYCWALKSHGSYGSVWWFRQFVPSAFCRNGILSLVLSQQGRNYCTAYFLYTVSCCLGYMKTVLCVISKCRMQFPT